MAYAISSITRRNKSAKAGDFLLPNAPAFVVAGDSAEARIFMTLRRFGPWSDVVTMTNPEASKREQDRVTDRPGRVFDSFGEGRHAMSRERTGRQQQSQRFAHDVAAFINKEKMAGHFRYLVLIVEPSFLGHLRQALSPTLRKSVVCELPLNPTSHDVDKLKSLFT